MQRLPQKRAWGTDDPARKGGDYFATRALAAPPADAIPTPRPPLDGSLEQTSGSCSPLAVTTED